MRNAFYFHFVFTLSDLVFHPLVRSFVSVFFFFNFFFISRKCRTKCFVSERPMPYNWILCLKNWKTKEKMAENKRNVRYYECECNWTTNIFSLLVFSVVSVRLHNCNCICLPLYLACLNDACMCENALNISINRNVRVSQCQRRQHCTHTDEKVHSFFFYFFHFDLPSLDIPIVRFCCFHFIFFRRVSNVQRNRFLILLFFVSFSLRRAKWTKETCRFVCLRWALSSSLHINMKLNIFDYGKKQMRIEKSYAERRSGEHQIWFNFFLFLDYWKNDITRNLFSF